MLGEHCNRPNLPPILLFVPRGNHGSLNVPTECEPGTVLSTSQVNKRNPHDHLVSKTAPPGLIAAETKAQKD